MYDKDTYWRSIQRGSPAKSLSDLLGELTRIQERHEASKRDIQQEDEMATQDTKRIIEKLREANADHSLIEALANAAMPEDSGIKRHDGRDIMLPEGMDFDYAVRTIHRVEQDLEQGTTNEYYFEGYAYDDVLVALDKAIRKMFGFAIQQAQRTIFGVQPPSTRTVTIGRDERGRRITKQVPEGMIALPGLYDKDESVGRLKTNNTTPPRIVVYLRKRHQQIGEQLAELVRHYLQTQSIYRGHIVNAALDFVSFGDFDRDALVLNRAVRQNIENNVMLHILNPDLADRIGAEPQRSALFYGPYGTGKSMALREIAERASDNGVTVFMYNGDQDMTAMLKWARNYQPSVVMIEDVDQELSGARGHDMNDILNTLDGALGKQDRVFTVMTTNNPERIHESALRPGRISVAVKFGALDGQGLQRLIGQNGLNFSESIDWETLAEDYPRLMPCHIKEAGNRLGFQYQHANGDLSGEDVRLALEGMMDHLRLQEGAEHRNEAVTLEELLARITRDQVEEVNKEMFR